MRSLNGRRDNDERASAVRGTDAGCTEPAAGAATDASGSATGVRPVVSLRPLAPIIHERAVVPMSTRVDVVAATETQQQRTHGERRPSSPFPFSCCLFRRRFVSMRVPSPSSCVCECCSFVPPVVSVLVRVISPVADALLLGRACGSSVAAISFFLFVCLFLPVIVRSPLPLHVSHTSISKHTRLNEMERGDMHSDRRRSHQHDTHRQMNEQQIDPNLLAESDPELNADRSPLPRHADRTTTGHSSPEGCSIGLSDGMAIRQLVQPVTRLRDRVRAQSATSLPTAAT